MATSTLLQLAELVCGKIVGDPNTEIFSADPLSDAKSGSITLLDDPLLAKRLAKLEAAAAVVPTGFEQTSMPSKSVLLKSTPVIVVDDVHSAFIKIVKFIRPVEDDPQIGVSPLAFIDETAEIAEGVEIHPGVTIGKHVRIGKGCTIHPGVSVMNNCTIGEDVTIFPNAVLYPRTEVGSRVILHAGAVIGCYGFGYRHENGQHLGTAQLGSVEIGEDVEIGAGSTIDRGTYGRTVIGNGTKIDNLVQIAHNCHIGKHNMLCAQVGIAGSSSTGDYVVMAGQVGVRDHVHIGTGAVLGAKTGVANHVAEGVRMIGIPATLEREQKIKQAAFSKLPDMRRQLKQLQKAVEALTRNEIEERRSSAA